MVETYTLFFDGSCWPNPGGLAAFGFTLHKGGELIDSKHGIIGEGPTFSNNVAEYYALCQGFKSFMEKHDYSRCILNVYGDSQLIINQMSGKWKNAKGGLYKPYHDRAKAMKRQVNAQGAQISFDWIPRAKNAEADRLSKLHLEKVEKPANLSEPSTSNEQQDNLAELRFMKENNFKIVLDNQN